MDSPYEEGPRDKDELREQDRFLPIANVARIMKRGIPETGKVCITHNPKFIYPEPRFHLRCYEYVLCATTICEAQAWE